MSKRTLLPLIPAGLLLLAGLAAAGALLLSPLGVVTRYPWPMLTAEAATMSNCTAAGCHEPAAQHTCATCHDHHGSAHLKAVPFAGLLLLTGDVPTPTYVPINDILPVREVTRTVMPLLDFLAQQGVDDFESVTLSAGDGGLVTIAREDLTPQSLLMPYADGVRFADEKLHVSTWLRGINRIVVVGRERPLRIDGQATSIGRLLLGPTRWATVEQAQVMLRSAEDGLVRRAQTAARVEGAAVGELVAHPAFATLTVRDARGGERTLTAAEAQGALLAVVYRRVTLVLPGRGRAQWVEDVVEIRSQP